MKHSPGPWSTYVNTATNVVVRKMFADGLEASEIARVKSANAIPDARLIATAPDLLEALQLVVDTAENGGWPSAALVVAKGAIAKAMGQELEAQLSAIGAPTTQAAPEAVTFPDPVGYLYCGGDYGNELEKTAAPSAQQGETNAQLDTDSNSSAPGQQRDVDGTVALGQPVGHGSDSTAGDPSAQGDKLLTVAERNIRSFLRSATFKSESDREAALNCVDVLSAAPKATPAPAPAAQGDALDTVRLNWLEGVEGRFYNIDRISAVVGTGFLTRTENGTAQISPTLRAAIDAASAATHASKEGEKHDQ